LHSTFKVLHKDDKETMELCSTLLQKRPMPSTSCGFLYLSRALSRTHGTYLFTFWKSNLSGHNSEFMVLCLKVAICACCWNLCVCYFPGHSSVTRVGAHAQNFQWHRHKIVVQNSGTLWSTHTFLSGFDCTEITLIHSYLQFHCAGWCKY